MEMETETCESMILSEKMRIKKEIKLLKTKIIFQRFFILGIILFSFGTIGSLVLYVKTLRNTITKLNEEQEVKLLSQCQISNKINNQLEPSQNIRLLDQNDNSSVAKELGLVGLDLGSGLKDTKATIRLTNGEYNGNKLSPKVYKSGWKGGSRAKIKTYELKPLGKVCSGIGKVIELYELCKVAKNEYDETGGLGQKTFDKAKEIGGGISGAAVGGVLGGAIGSVVPIIGTAIGAGVGSAIGGFVGEKIADLIKIKIDFNIRLW